MHKAALAAWPTGAQSHSSHSSKQPASRPSTPTDTEHTHTRSLSHDSTPRRLAALFAPHHHTSPSHRTTTTHNQMPLPPNAGLLPPRSHSRADSAPREAAFPGGSMPAPSSSNLSMNSAAASKPHTSPSKTTAGRTYDARLVSREMHRLGTLSPAHSHVHLPHAHLPAAPLPPAPTPAADERDNPWGALHVHVLPLFNGEPLRVPIEDLNALVRRHVAGAVALAPGRALAALEGDAGELVRSGMVTLNAKFVGVEEGRLLARVVDMWGFFWDQVLPYVEGALLPLQTDPLLAALYRKPHRGASPPPEPAVSAMGSAAHPHIDVRTVALRAFRDQIILPLAPRLYARLAMPNRVLENAGFLEARCNQMLLVLAFQTRAPAPPPSALSPRPPPPPGPGEKALAELVRALRLPSAPGGGSITARAPSFLSEGAPRDRRGRIAQKPASVRVPGVEGEGYGFGEGEGYGGDGEETPRNGGREFLEALRSPEQGRAGGWGLGVRAEEDGKDGYGEDDEPLTWDEAQLMVENVMIYTSKLSRAEGDHAGANGQAIRDVPGRMFEAYERKGFAKDRSEAERQAKKDKEQAQAAAAATPKLGRKMT
ncbi:hypothetical protein HWV62_3572 [Athelia sp. TMB]|nr:hypothetical protein HWV62_3572 [Athelia sp. TMB]